MEQMSMFDIFQVKSTLHSPLFIQRLIIMYFCRWGGNNAGTVGDLTGVSWKQPLPQQAWEQDWRATLYHIVQHPTALQTNK